MNKVGRNDPCPCGSGQKFKKCCEAKQTKKPFTAIPLTAQGVFPGKKALGLTAFFQEKVVTPITPPSPLEENGNHLITS